MYNIVALKAFLVMIKKRKWYKIQYSMTVQHKDVLTKFHIVLLGFCKNALKNSFKPCFFKTKYNKYLK